ncbi:YncE family protein, partial [candidate division KSB1 bacterium]
SWGSANGSLSYYDFNEETAYNNIFKTANGRDLGDTPNHMVINDDKIYIVMNGSNLMEIIGRDNAVSITSVDLGAGFAPAFMAKYADMLFITSLYNSSVSVFNMSNNSLVPENISVSMFPEGIIQSGGKIYAANSGFGSGNTVTVIDAETRTVLKEIAVSENPRFFAEGPSGNLFVICAGAYNDFANPDDDTYGKIFKISPLDDSIVDSFLVGGHPGKFDISSNGRGYVSTETGIMEFDTEPFRIINENFIEGNYYCVKVRQSNGDIWVADAKDFLSAGEVSIYSSGGTFRKSFYVGISPGEIVFEER